MASPVQHIPARNLLAPQPLGAGETERVLKVCNACRYCEAMCPVFSELAQHRSPALAEFNYLANLCHNCGACLDVCQYAEPHPFALDLPRVLANQRLDSYQQFAWPQAFASGLRRQPQLVLTLLLGLLTALLLTFSLTQSGEGLWFSYAGQGSFYAVMPHHVMASLGGLSFGFALLSLGVSCWRFARHLELEVAALVDWRSWWVALTAGITLRYLGDSQGCQSLSASQPSRRRLWHHLMAGGFLLCFASTCVATFYHYGLGRVAPYAWTSLPVMLGVLGGLGLVFGPLALVLLKRRLNLEQDPVQAALSNSFLVLLAWVSATGLLLLALREHASMPLVLAVHLAAVFSLFVLLPYSKFVHAPFRLLALLKQARGAGLAQDAQTNQ